MVFPEGGGQDLQGFLLTFNGFIVGALVIVHKAYVRVRVGCICMLLSKGSESDPKGFLMVFKGFFLFVLASIRIA